MEPDISIESGCMIRVVVLSVGQMPTVYMREYVSMVVRHTRIELSSVSSFYTEHQKSPFAQQPWDSGCLRFKFLVGGASRSPWEDFQAQRKIHGVIGLCHCPTSPDLGAVYEQFLGICKTYPSVLAKRCLAFYPDGNQVGQEDKKRQHLIVFPPADRQTLELQMQTLMQDLAASLLMEFESWVLHAESVGAILTTPLDSQASLSSEEVGKSKKRRLGRAQKTIGDYCLLAGSPVDANAHYSTAIELARLTGDVFWNAGALEGCVCALVVDYMGVNEQYIQDEVKFRYFEVLQLYRRATAIAFELESTLKLARFLSRKDLAREVVELLMGAVDGAKNLTDANDRLVLNVEISRIFASLGYKRKAAFFARQVAQLYLQQETRWAAISALQVLALTAETYHVQSKRACVKGSGLLDSIGSTSNGKWSTLQMDVLDDMLLSSVRAGDPLAAWSSAARLLRGHYPRVTPTGQANLAAALTASADRLPLGTRCSDPALPFIRLHSFPDLPSQMEIVKRTAERKEWWADSASSGPFIYTPFAREGDSSNDNKLEIIWVVGEPVQLFVELANPCAVEVSVESIYLSVESGKFEAYPVSVTIQPNSSQTLLLSGVPLTVGPLSVRGCIVHCFGVVVEHLFDDIDELLSDAAKGLVLRDPFRSTGGSKLRHVPKPTIVVVPPLPLLVAQFVGGGGAAVLYEGEIRDVQISLVNAGLVPAAEAILSLTGKQQEHVVYIGHDILKAALPLQPGASVVVPVKLKAGQLSSDTEIVRGMAGTTGKILKDSSGPLLVLHYAGLSTENEVVALNGTAELPPGRRLAIPLQIHVLRGLCLIHARLLSMEVPTQISRNLPNPSLEVADTEDSIVKIDPYRGSWGLRLLELELWNPTDVVFEITVCLRRRNDRLEDSKVQEGNYLECLYPSTRIDRDYSSRVLVPLERLKLPSLGKALFNRTAQAEEVASAKSERQTRAELNATIKELSSRICVKWNSGRNSSGELAIKDAIQEALQASALDVLLPDPLTFGFRLAPKSPTDGVGNGEATSRMKDGNEEASDSKCKAYILAHELTPLEMLLRNNTRETITMSLNVGCHDVAGENCLNGNKASVLWTGALNGVEVEVPPLGEIVHTFALCFLVPGEYTLVGAAFIHGRSETVKIQWKQPHSVDTAEPVYCSGPPFRLYVAGAL
eukprot:c28007_g1_i1 orf=213-3731(+)